MADYVFKLTLPYSPRAEELVSSEQPRASLNRVGRLLNRVASGRVPGAAAFVADCEAAAASATVTFAALQADDTVTVGTQVFVAKASPSGVLEFALGASDTAAATNFAAKVNAHTSLTGVASAAAVDAVTTVTCLVPGLVGNAMRFASSNGTRAATTGSGNLAGGTTTRTALSF